MEIVYYFLHQGASIDIPCHKYGTLVETAIACRHTRSIHLEGILVILLAHEELKKAITLDEDSRKTLSIAIEGGFEGLLFLLLKMDTCPNALVENALDVAVRA